MLAVVFTLDYEIYGNGKGSLRELVLDPTERLADLFRQFNAPLVIFVEALEFAKMEECQSDDAISGVAAQLRRLRAQGQEIGFLDVFGGNGWGDWVEWGWLWRHLKRHSRSCWGLVRVGE
jgi:hypothetical protein